MDTNKKKRYEEVLRSFLETLEVSGVERYLINLDNLNTIDLDGGILIVVTRRHDRGHNSFIQNQIRKFLGLRMIVVSAHPSDFNTIKEGSELEELYQGIGQLDIDPITPYFQYVVHTLDEKGKDLRIVFDKYYRDILGFDTSKISELDFQEFFNFIMGGSKPLKMRNYVTYANITEFAFFIADKFFKLKSGGFGLSYFIEKNKYGRKTFYFFDPIMAIFIGTIEIDKVPSKKEVYKILSSAAEKKLIGLGYGTKMYLSILDTCDYLQSDNMLYEGSLRLWTTSLPKYANVWFIFEDERKKIQDFERVIAGQPLTADLTKISRFVASTKYNKLKI